MSEKILYFDNYGSGETDPGHSDVGYIRICTAFHLDDGRPVYLALDSRIKAEKEQCIRWAFVHFCHYITDDHPNDDCNLHRLSVESSEFAYTKDSILKFVNRLGASFDSVEVPPRLGGYCAFTEEKPTQGTKGYNYGDEFRFDPVMTARREAIYNSLYQQEQLQGVRFPNFQLWADQKDAGMLHLLRHYNGYNKHWVIRTDIGETVEAWLSTAKETVLGKYGC